VSTEIELSDHCLVDHPRAARDGVPQLVFSRKMTLWKSMLFVDRKMHFTGVRGAAWRILGVDRSLKNPNICNI